MKLRGWWSGRSNPEKVELYTRWSYYTFGLIEIGAIGVRSVVEAPPPVSGWLLMLVCAHTALGGVLASRALDWNLGRRGYPSRLITAHSALSGMAAVAVLVLHRFGTLGDMATSAALVVGFLGFGIASLVLCQKKVRHMLYLVMATAAGTGLVCLLLGLPREEAAGFSVGFLIAGVTLAFTSGFSGWLLRAVWELDAARELQARLAVAEERLRFGRDLHDVMGRNLSVIALKSELAVQLARRGRAEQAVDQMTEVQRIAQESQREVREVVRGYREADLHIELEGAQGVLTAAGITCTVESAEAGLPARVQSALAWVVREAATNVLRHGDARHCSVSVGAEEGCAVLVVENDGAGGDPGVLGESGSGLAGLRERLAALDGTLQAGRMSGGRFRVTARVPVNMLPAGAGAGAGAGAAVGAADTARAADSARAR
ncbi:sensor histidine kinase [Streptomyces ficellus]|uniref:Sensor histidine kinase n=1 Tax=Streptomyces ficellus TaxID=1977088 RepID=A0ABT7ZAG3_9ACTN|nr:sensor histidine kinase [Streptomyces ficellus]MDN3296423.1 sensor histidine kinase [Streptomyces ficellus]